MRPWSACRRSPTSRATSERKSASGNSSTLATRALCAMPSSRRLRRSWPGDALSRRTRSIYRRAGPPRLGRFSPLPGRMSHGGSQRRPAHARWPLVSAGQASCSSSSQATPQTGWPSSCSTRARSFLPVRPRLGSPMSRTRPTRARPKCAPRSCPSSKASRPRTCSSAPRA